MCQNSKRRRAVVEDGSYYEWGDEDDSEDDGNGGGKDKCRGMISRTGCTNHGAMGSIGSMKTIRGKSSNEGRRRSGGEDTVRRDSGILQAPIDEIQCVGCDDTQHSIGIPDARVDMMSTNQETNDGHQADTEEDTSGPSVAGEDDAADDSSDSDDSMSSQMTEFLENKRFNKKGNKVPVNEWFSGALCACATGMRRGLVA